MNNSNPRFREHAETDIFIPFLRKNFLGMSGIIRTLLLLNIVGLLGIWASAASAEQEGAKLLLQPMNGFNAKLTEKRAAPVSASLLTSHITSRITGHVVRTTVQQTYRNPTNDWVEGMYFFPLPDDAAVDQMKLTIGERTIVSEIKEKEVARRAYVKAASQGKVSALLTQYRPNMFSTRVANIEPGGQVQVDISFQSLARQSGTHFSWRMPQAIVPRYSPVSGASVQTVGTDAEPGAQNVETNVFPSQDYFSASGNENVTGFDIVVAQADRYQEITSPSHAIVSSPDKKGDARIALEKGGVPADRDFILNWSFALGDQVRPVVFQEQYGNVEYSMGFILPPKKGKVFHQQPRDVTFILDISGSMHGTAMDQAKAGLSTALDLLKPADRFEIIAFNSEYFRLFGNSRPATPQNIVVAKEFVGQLMAEHGTEMYPALASALSDQAIEGFQKQIMFLTDGAVTNEADMFQLVNDKLDGRRLFTVGVGSAPNGWFMRKAAEFGRGTYVQISNLNEARAELVSLFEDMSQPTLQDVGLDLGPDVEIYPKILPDLFGRRPIVYVAKTTGGDRPKTVSGTLPNGERTSFVLPNAQQKGSTDIGKLWASHKVESLMDASARGMDPEIVRTAVLDVALEHQIMSPFTSFIAIDKTPARIKEDFMSKMKIAGNLPKGTSWEKIYGPQTATPMNLLLIGGLMSFLAAVSLLFWRKREGV